MQSEHRFISFDETAIFYRRFEPKGTPRASVILLHGMGEHGGRYRQVAEYLADQNLRVFLPDLRGFGKSGGRRAFAGNFSDFHQDLLALHQHAQRQDKAHPIFLMGHSFGGLLASSYLAFANPPKVHGLILSSPIFGIKIPVPVWRHVLGVLMARVYPAYTQSTRVNPEKLTHDVEIKKIYAQDTLIYHHITAALYRELTALLRKKDAIAMSIKNPTLVLQAGQDEVVSKDAVIQFFELLKVVDKELKIYPDLSITVVGLR